MPAMLPGRPESRPPLTRVANELLWRGVCATLWSQCGKTPEDHMARRTLPKELAADAPTHKSCPDCFAEGRDPYVLPIAKFYVRKSPRYKGGLRISAYCIEHENKRRAVSRQALYQEWLEEERRTGVAPPQLVKERARRVGAKPSKEAKERDLKRKKELYAADPEKYKKANRDYLAKPGKAEARKKYVADWYQRRGKQLRKDRQARRAPLTLGQSLLRRRQAPEEPAPEA